MARNDIRPGYEVELLKKGFAATVKEALPASVKTVYFEDNYLSYREYEAFASALTPDFTLVGDEKVLSDLRIVKREDEIEKIRKAQSYTDAAFAHICAFISENWKSGTLTEKRIATEIDYAMKCAGAANPSFDTIVASGENGSKPHAVPSDRIIRDGDMITMDFGAIHDGYCSDMTRTVAVGYATEEMKEVYETVLRAQEAAIAATRAGISGSAIDKVARDIIRQAGYGEYFGHGYGHSLGQQIHEDPNCRPEATTILQPGVVCSAEPGIYLPGKFGVRIEDLVVVRETGFENLNTSSKLLLEL
jgi:Xaa-Pro aminopeptidase